MSWECKEIWGGVLVGDHIVAFGVQGAGFGILGLREFLENARTHGEPG